MLKHPFPKVDDDSTGGPGDRCPGQPLAAKKRAEGRWKEGIGADVVMCPQYWQHHHNRVLIINANSWVPTQTYQLTNSKSGLIPEEVSNMICTSTSFPSDFGACFSLRGAWGHQYQFLKCTSTTLTEVQMKIL